MIKCPFCKDSFASKRQLAEHLDLRENPSNKTIKDIQNGKPFVYIGLNGKKYQIAYKNFQYRIESEKGRLLRVLNFEQAEQIIFDATDPHNKAQIAKAMRNV